jgi:hypothetical protein
VWNHVAVWGSVAAWFLFIVVYSPIPSSTLLGPNLIAWVTYKAMASAFFWYTLRFTPPKHSKHQR